MKLSTRSRYGVRILLELARNVDGGPVKVSKISHEQQITVKYLEQLIRSLKKGGLVKSFRGAKGGHLLAKDPHKILLGQVVRLLEEKSDLVECIPNPKICDLSDTCRVRLAWKEASKALFDKLNAISIADLMGDDILGCSTPPSAKRKSS